MTLPDFCHLNMFLNTHFTATATGRVHRVVDRHRVERGSPRSRATSACSAVQPGPRTHGSCSGRQVWRDVAPFLPTLRMRKRACRHMPVPSKHGYAGHAPDLHRFSSHACRVVCGRTLSCNAGRSFVLNGSTWTTSRLVEFRGCSCSCRAKASTSILTQ